jgi:hypothetical protein
MAVARLWTNDEIALLVRCAGKMTATKIAMLVNRKPAGVRDKARELGISLKLTGDLHQAVKHPCADVELARQLREAGMKRRVIAEKLEIPLRTIDNFIHYRRK